MNCDHITERLSEYLDGALSPADQAAVEAHLAECPACREAFEKLRRTVELVAGLPRYHAPAGFQARVGARIEAESANSPADRPRLVRLWPRRLALAASVLVAVGLAFVLGLSLPRPDHGRRAMRVEGVLPATPTYITDEAADERVAGSDLGPGSTGIAEADEILTGRKAGLAGEEPMDDDRAEALSKVAGADAVFRSIGGESRGKAGPTPQNGQRSEATVDSIGVGGQTAVPPLAEPPAPVRLTTQIAALEEGALKRDERPAPAAMPSAELPVDSDGKAVVRTDARKYGKEVAQQMVLPVQNARLRVRTAAEAAHQVLVVHAEKPHATAVQTVELAHLNNISDVQMALPAGDNGEDIEVELNVPADRYDSFLAQVSRLSPPRSQMLSNSLRAANNEYFANVRDNYNLFQRLPAASQRSLERNVEFGHAWSYADASDVAKKARASEARARRGAETKQEETEVAREATARVAPPMKASAKPTEAGEGSGRGSASGAGRTLLQLHEVDDPETSVPGLVQLTVRVVRHPQPAEEH